MRTFAAINNLKNPKNTGPENIIYIQIDVTKILPVSRFHQEHFCFSQLRAAHSLYLLGTKSFGGDERDIRACKYSDKRYGQVY